PAQGRRAAARRPCASTADPGRSGPALRFGPAGRPFCPGLLSSPTVRLCCPGLLSRPAVRLSAPRHPLRPVPGFDLRPDARADAQRVARPDRAARVTQALARAPVVEREARPRPPLLAVPARAALHGDRPGPA